MRTKLILTCIGIFITNFSFAQSIKPLHINGCNTKVEHFVVAETSPTWKSDQISFNDYMKNFLTASPKMKRLLGDVLLGIMVYANGEVCLNTFLDINEAGFIPEEFKIAINQMPQWNPATQNGKPVNFNHMMLVKIHKGKILKD